MVHTDNAEFAATLFAPEALPLFGPCPPTGRSGEPLRRLFSDPSSVRCAPTQVPGWPELYVSDFAPRSQYDQLIEWVRAGVELPTRLACVARAGTGFHGSKGRAWQASAGNVHLAVHLAPRRSVDRFETIFTALAAVSVAEAIDSVPELAGRASIKWVNDVLVDGAKVGGVLAYTQTKGSTISAIILGIGLNVEAAPPVDRSPFVPAAGCLRQFVATPAAVSVGGVLRALLAALDLNQQLLLMEGYQAIMDRYRGRSAVIGREVTILEDDVTADPRVLSAGTVTAIGDGLELHLRDVPRPVTRGRLVLAPAAELEP